MRRVDTFIKAIAGLLTSLRYDTRLHFGATLVGLLCLFLWYSVPKFTPEIANTFALPAFQRDHPYAGIFLFVWTLAFSVLWLITATRPRSQIHLPKSWLPPGR